MSTDPVKYKTGNEKTYALLLSEAHESDDFIRFMLGLREAYELEQIIVKQAEIQLFQLSSGDTLVLPSFRDLGCSEEDLWPIVIQLYQQGVILVVLDIGFNSSGCKGDLVMDTVIGAVESQRNYFSH
ncbi:hypothetical protein [Endozoicomonas euniceicola]|uniref:Uncharacterized protein n=1 Tax=Endozoicomonas euniceicola TaxID=1234143 RepID=A0ABY6GTS5_9GAMM|nr:hypothetical protein [Endozoicomonas euniceicola]UYM16180.1 hypothetical protein NX720_25855 [Endozoicomonas euniceicola]